ncbi:MAG: GNAT family N-acetyltransferase [Acidimicrobiia bacterium]|jgi:RimJ/RimL family protein N-acetyltransferase|nr:GNAT family N-acetyltransferase [Acidimicrobiia bacterium]
MGNPHWPLFGLRIRTPRLELRHPDDELVCALATLASQGVHPPEEMPFSVPWTDGAPGVTARNVCQWLWRQRAEWQPDRWGLSMAVVVDGVPVGLQDMAGEHFLTCRTVRTGSWLGLGHHGQGIGTEMRAAVLHLAFAGLGAVAAESGAFADNPASHAVSRKLGYERNGVRCELRRGAPATMIGLRLDRDRWASRRRDDITIDGLQPCLPLFALGPP